MALNPQLVYMPPFEIQLWDKDLNVPLAGGIVTFYQDKNQNVLKPVYQLVGDGLGTYSYAVLPNPLILSGIGTFVDGSGNNLQVYMYPYEGTPDAPTTTPELYYITVESSTLVPQETVKAWPPGIIASGSPINEADTTENILSNAQFSDVSFSPSAISSGTAITFSTTGTNTATQIAPDWYVVTTGAGTFSVYQKQVTDDTAPGNPAYAIGFTSTGYTQPPQLRQRLTNPRLFAGQYVSGTLIAQATAGGPYTIKMNYTPSITGTIQQIFTGSTVPGGFVTLSNNGGVQITDPGSGTGYVDITIVIPLGASVEISCIQLCGVSNSTEIVTYLQQPPQREEDHLFNYFSSLLQFKPAPSYLVGWDFPLNPAQFGSSIAAVASGANTSYYSWDQTILFQSANSGITVAADSATDGLSLTAAATTQMGVIQYLTGSKVNSIMVQALQGLSVNIRCSSSVAQKLNVSLWWAQNTADIPTMTITSNIAQGASLVSALDANGVPSVAAGWTEIKCQNLSSKIKTNNTNTIQDYGCFNFLDTTGTAYQNAQAFAIVIGTDSIAMNNKIIFNSISLTPGNNPTIPAPQTVDEVLRECQYYYESSYLVGVLPGTNTTTNQKLLCMNSITAFGTGTNVAQTNASPFEIDYYTKRTNPNISIYTPSGTLASVLATLNYAKTGGSAFTTATSPAVLATFWNTAVIGTNKASYTTKTINPIADVADASNSEIFTTGSIAFHFVADSRLGVV